MKPLVIVTRNKYVESLHYGLVCVVNSDGHILHHIGDIHTKIFFRSCAKPLQVIPLVQSGGAQALGFSLKDIAIACASHSGQEFHQRTVDAILKNLDLNEVNLHCGIMNPYNEEEGKRLAAKGLSPSVFHCACSGKHSAMLALGKYRGYSLDDYEKITNPVQQEILKTIADFTDEEPESIPVGIDGCGAPIYVLPIYKIALSYARLVQYAQDSHNSWHNACETVYKAMTQYPEMVSGDDEFCTELMRVTKDKLIGKVGSEGVYCVGIKEGNLGICVKIVDGNERAAYPAAMQVLKELNILDVDEFTALQSWYNPVLKNNLEDEIGEIKPVFQLKNPTAGSFFLGDSI